MKGLGSSWSRDGQLESVLTSYAVGKNGCNNIEFG